MSNNDFHAFKLWERLGIGCRKAWRPVTHNHARRVGVKKQSWKLQIIDSDLVIKQLGIIACMQTFNLLVFKLYSKVPKNIPVHLLPSKCHKSPQRPLIALPLWFYLMDSKYGFWFVVVRSLDRIYSRIKLNPRKLHAKIQSWFRNK